MDALHGKAEVMARKLAVHNHGTAGGRGKAAISTRDALSQLLSLIREHRVLGEGMLRRREADSHPSSAPADQGAEASGRGGTGPLPLPHGGLGHPRSFPSHL
jgi:hypothetical protein